MEVTVTEFRENMFELVDRALKGENVCLNYKGKRLRLVPETLDQPATESAFARFRSITPIDLSIEAALDEHWRRDPFDRVVVAHAKANGLARLVSGDRKIQTNYSRTIW